MIHFERSGLLNRLIATQELPIGIDQAWDFLSDPNNLKIITPDEMGFVVTTKSDTQTMYAGQIIEYTVTPMLGIKTSWVTEITHVHDKMYFVDEQRFGPYQLWHHKHFIKKTANGVEMKDIIDYKVPLGYIGQLVNTLFIKNKLQHIFEYRKEKLENIFKKN